MAAAVVAAAAAATAMSAACGGGVGDRIIIATLTQSLRSEPNRVSLDLAVGFSALLLQENMVFITKYGA